MSCWIIGWLVDLSWGKILVPLLFVLFRKKQNNHYSVNLFNTSWKPSNENFVTRCDKTGYITVAVLLCSKWETACVKPDAILRRERNDDNSPRTARISYSYTFTSADLFLGDGGRIEIVSKSRNNLLPLTALLLKDQSDCEIPAAIIWLLTQGPVRVCIRPYFSERTT